MSSKTRKLIWSVPLMATLAVVGALAVFVALGLPNANPAEAQDGDFDTEPGAPADIALTAGNGEITVVITEPANPGIPEFKGYKLQYNQHNGAASPAANDTGWTDVSGTVALRRNGDGAIKVTGLTNSMKYYFRAAVTFGTDMGPYRSDDADYATPVAGRPGKPEDITVTQSGVNEITVTWKAPANDGGSPIIAYRVKWNDNTGEDDEKTITDLRDGLTTTLESEHLTANAKVTVKVWARNSIDDAVADGAEGMSSTFTMSDAPDITKLAFRGTISSSSTSGGVAPDLTLVISSLSSGLPVGSSIVLYLEDDFNEPDSIPASSVYFVADRSKSVPTGNGARVYATTAARVDTDDYFDATKKDISIRVFIPDMCTSDASECSSADGPEKGQRLTMVIEKTSEIKNPTEAGSHSADFRVIGPADSVPLIGPAGGKAAHKGIVELETGAKIELSDNNNKRGFEMVVIASGFNDGTSAVAYVLVQQTGEPTCEDVISGGVQVGDKTVGSDDVAKIAVAVSSPTFKPGKVNYICVSDGEGRRADGDVEQFELEDSIRVVPDSVNAGDTVTVFAEDFTPGLPATKVEVGGVDIFGWSDAKVSIPVTRSDGSSTGTFVMPSSINGNPVVGIKAVKVHFGTANAATKITVAPAGLVASKTDVLPNESITITGSGFGTQSCVPVKNIKLDDVAIQVDTDSRIRCDPDGSSGPLDTIDAVEVSNSGQFVATVTLWQETGTDNPTLIFGSHTLKVEDSKGFTGSTTLTIAEPTISVVPEVAGPRDYVTIRGANWPVDNPDNSNAGLVQVEIEDDPRGKRLYNVYTNGTGGFAVEHRVSKDVTIPSSVKVTVSYGTTAVVKIGSFAIPAATIKVEPAAAQPGDLVTLSATDMKPYASADEVKIGGSEVNFDSTNTDIDGNISLSNLLVPGLDPGVYSILMNVDGTIAIGELEILAEDSAAGAKAELPGALEALGDNLVRVFHHNGVTKDWDFFDPRPDYAEASTLKALVNGAPYWVLVSEGQENVLLNNKAHTLTCVDGDCWNQIVW